MTAMDHRAKSTAGGGSGLKTSAGPDMADASVMLSVANFVTKLYDLVEQPDTDGHIHWGATGESFLVLNTTQFAQLVLPMHFKHDNLRSFERQLNIYGFQRCIEQPTVHGLEFFHPKSRREQRNLLVEIKRSQKRQISALAEAAPEPSRVAEELAGLESVQQTMLALQADVHASEGGRPANMGGSVTILISVYEYSKFSTSS